MNQTFKDFDKLKTEVEAGRGIFYYYSYGRPVIINSKSVSTIRKGKSVFLLRGKFLHAESLGFREC